MPEKGIKFLPLAIIKEGRNVPRKGHIAKRDVLADPIYNNKVVTKLINNIMLDGKKELPRRSYTVHSTVLKRKPESLPSKYSKRQ